MSAVPGTIQAPPAIGNFTPRQQTVPSFSPIPQAAINPPQREYQQPQVAQVPIVQSKNPDTVIYYVPILLRDQQAAPSAAKPASPTAAPLPLSEETTLADVTAPAGTVTDATVAARPEVRVPPGAWASTEQYAAQMGNTTGTLVDVAMRQMLRRNPSLRWDLQSRLPIEELKQIEQNPDELLEEFRTDIQRSRVNRFVLNRFGERMARWLVPYQFEDTAQLFMRWLRAKPGSSADFDLLA